MQFMLGLQRAAKTSPFEACPHHRPGKSKAAKKKLKQSKRKKAQMSVRPSVLILGAAYSGLLFRNLS